LSGIALKKDGTVVTWGANDFGQLGHAPNTNGDSTCGVGSGVCNPTPAAVVDPVWKL
jgi:alpha-tubulin suppressor-like RCC1 family protein